MNNDKSMRTDPQASFRVGVLGCGEQGRESRIPAAQELADVGVEVVAVADNNLERAREVAEEFGIPSSYPSLEAMVEGSLLDGVIVVVPPAEHADAVTYALRHGLHVLCEKPFGRNAEEARAMIRAAEDAGRVLATGYQHPLAVARLVKHVFSRRVVGTPRHIEAAWLCSAGGSDGAIPGRPGFSNEAGDLGFCGDLASYLLSVVMPMLGSAPATVSAVRRKDHGVREHGDELAVEDTLTLVVDCENQARAHFTTALWADIAEDEISIGCHGSSGSMWVPMTAGELDAEMLRPTIRGADGGLRRGESPVPTDQAFVAQQLNWVGACRGKAVLVSRPEDAVAVHVVLEAAYRSAKLGGDRIFL